MKRILRVIAILGVGIVLFPQLVYAADPPEPVQNAVVIVNGNNIDLSWVKDDPEDKTLVLRSYNAYPQSITDGFQVYYGSGVSVVDVGANNQNEVAYYTLYSQESGGIYSAPIFLQAGGLGMLAFNITFLVLGFLVIAIVMTIASYAVKRTPLAAFTAVFWVVLMGVALSQLSTSPVIYGGLAVIGLIAAIGMSIQAYGFRDKDEEAADTEDGMTFEERLKANREERLEFSRNRKEARKVKDEEREDKAIQKAKKGYGIG